MKKLNIYLITFSFLGSILNTSGAEDIKHDDKVKIVPFSKKYFKPDPVYKNEDYSFEKQLEIYGGKYSNRVPFHLTILGRRMYETGNIPEGYTWFGKLNPIHPRLSVFGDWRVAAVHNDDGVENAAGVKDKFQELNTRLNLDVDFAITSTERIHAFFRPFDDGVNFTGFTFSDDEEKNNTEAFDMIADTLFFEGDLGPILSGITGEYNHIDFPFAFGLIPMLFHNGIWVNDAFVGAGFTFPAMNSRSLDISNMDLTFFYGYDKLNSAVIQGDNNDDDAKIVGFNWFADALRGHFEFGYGYTEDESDRDQSYHNTMLSYTHRWYDVANTSYRVLHNFGAEDLPGTTDTKLADGTLVLIETSWQTSLPYTLVPYTNFFLGHKNPQPFASVNTLLINTGIVFEGDNMSQFQTVENTANDTYGGAFGVQYLFNLDKQVVFEVATVQPLGGEKELDRNLLSAEYAAGTRIQIPLSNELIWRADSVYSIRQDQENIFSARMELRFKY